MNERQRTEIFFAFFFFCRRCAANDACVLLHMQRLRPMVCGDRVFIGEAAALSQQRPRQLVDARQSLCSTACLAFEEGQLYDQTGNIMPFI